MSQRQLERPKVGQRGGDQKEVGDNTDASVGVEKGGELKALPVLDGEVPGCLDRPTLKDGGEDGTDANPDHQDGSCIEDPSETRVGKYAEVRCDDGEFGECARSGIEDVCHVHELRVQLCQYRTDPMENVIMYEPVRSS